MSAKKRPIQFGAHKLPPLGRLSHEERVRRARDMLSRVLNLRTAVAFVGSSPSTAIGLPRWRDFARALVNETLRSLEKNPTAARPPQIQRIKEYRDCLRQRRTIEPEMLRHYINGCQDVMLPDDKKTYAKFMRTTFGRRAKGKPNPYDVLVRLPVSRFVTTNYDCEIEYALARRHRIALSRFGLRKGSRESDDDEFRLSFTQEPRFANQLAVFALSRSHRNRNMVFHCHGRWDRIESIVASEADYQEKYLSRPEYRAFRQTLRLLLESNPLLFFGYGLHDEDLLQTLRQLGAVNFRQKHQRPLFALLPSTGEPEDQHYQEALFERFGLHVIPFRRPRSRARRDWARALCRALEDLGRDWEEARSEWLEKPVPRAPSAAAGDGRPCLIPHFTGETMKQLAEIPVSQGPEETFAAWSRAHVLGLTGPSGTGKTWMALSFLEAARRKRRYERFFYWHANYSNEPLSALDRAAAYLAPSPPGGPRLERVLGVLRSRSCLIILDGCERLLTPSDKPAEGYAYSADFRRIVREGAKVLVRDPDCRSTLLLVGQLWTSDLDQSGFNEEELARIVRVPTERVCASSLERHPRFRSCDPSEVSALCSLLDGHRYGLLLAAHYLTHKRGARLRNLLRVLEDKPAKRRLDSAIRLVLDLYRSEAAFLRQASLFHTPVHRSTLDQCRQCAVAAGVKIPGLRILLAKLRKSPFLLSVLRHPRQRSDPKWVVHHTLREYFARVASGSSTAPVFLPPGYTSAGAGVDPCRREHEVRNLFRRVCDQGFAASAGGSDARARELCRDAFSLLRAQMECNTAPRWTTYDDYMTFGIRLAELTKVVAPRLWSFTDRSDLAAIQHEDSPLYVAELSWLYNDVGLALFSEGLIADAFAVWEQAHDIDRLLEGSGPYGEIAVESLLNLCQAQIELGKLPGAREYFVEAERFASLLESPDLAARIRGFKGLFEHLQGNVRGAIREYLRCTRALGRTRNRRALSFFFRLEAEARLKLGEVEKARVALRSSRALAEQGFFPDLLAFSRIPQGRLLRQEKKLGDARLEYHAALSEAESLGIRQLEAIIQVELSELSLEQGDAYGAWESAMTALRLANELGLGLVVTRSLIALSRATVEVGDRPLGIAYLNTAKRRAERQSYWLRVREIERERRGLGLEHDPRLGRRAPRTEREP